METLAPRMLADQALLDRIRGGYSQNEIGFGWTNGVYSELLAQLQP